MLSLVSYFLIFNIILNHKCIILCLNYSFPTKYPEKLSVNWWTSKDNVTGERSAENDLSVNEDEVSKLSFSEFPSKKLKDYVDSSVFKQYEQLEKMEEPKYWSRFQRKMKENLIPSVLKDVPDQETEYKMNNLFGNSVHFLYIFSAIINDNFNVCGEDSDFSTDHNSNEIGTKEFILVEPKNNRLSYLNYSISISDSAYTDSSSAKGMYSAKYHIRHHDKLIEEFIPDVFPHAVPFEYLKVIFHPLVYNEKLKIFQKKKVIVDLGNHVIPSLAKQPPYLNWFDDWNKYYSVMMIDPDAPTIEHPIHRHWLHWLVVNSKGDKVHKGDIVAEYVGPCPQRGTGIHRYVVLIFMQKNKINFRKDIYISKTNFTIRKNFNYLEFAKKYKLREPVASNYFVSQWEKWVDQRYAGLREDYDIATF